MLILLAIFLLVFIWLSILTFFFFKLINHYNNLIKGTHATTLQDSLNFLLQDQAKTKKDIEMLKEKYVTIEKDASFHIQKIGLLRFNPFADTGGDQSFIVALVDGHSTGIVISGLYSRSGTRWYAKKVSEGKGVEHELSEYEKKALKEAK